MEKYDQNDMDYTEYAALRGNKMAVANDKEYYARPQDVSLSQTNLFPHAVVSVRDLRYFAILTLGWFDINLLDYIVNTLLAIS